MITELTTTERRQQQSAFIAALLAQGKGLSDMTAADREQAKALGFDVEPLPVRKCTPMPERVTYNGMLKAWGGL